MSRALTGLVKPLPVVGAAAALAVLSISPPATAATASGRSARPATASSSLQAGAAASCATGDPRAAADSYLAALTSHDASAVPLAPNVLRVEDGLVTGRSADEIRNDLNTSVKYRIIVGLRDRSYTQSPAAADGTVTEYVDYLLDVGTPPVTLLTVHVHERFDVQCGQISYINATIGLG